MRITQRQGLIDTDPAWEEAKAVRRNLRHEDAVLESEALTQQYRQLWSKSPVNVQLIDILRTLTQKRIPFVLTGAHGISAWTGRPRATHDVDVLTKIGRNHHRAVKAVHELYPELEVRAFPGVTGFFPPGEKEAMVDVSYPHRGDIEETLATAIWLDDGTLGLRYRVPALEAALANKYGAMLTLSRNLGKRTIDVADFIYMVKHSFDPGRTPIDREKLAANAARIWPQGGAEEILRLVDKVLADEPIDLGSLR